MKKNPNGGIRCLETTLLYVQHDSNRLYFFTFLPLHVCTWKNLLLFTIPFLPPLRKQT